MFPWQSVCKSSSTRISGYLVVASLFGSLMFPSLAQALPVNVQTLGNKSNAAPGESGANIPASALISVLVTNPSTGEPVTNLGASLGNGTTGISLPAGWSFLTGFNISPGGCGMSTTQFSNSGNGIYTIRVVPPVSNPACKWLAGDYHYLVRINGNFGGTSFTGSGLGVLKI